MYTWILKCWLKVYFCSHYSQKAVRFKMETFVKLIQDIFFKRANLADLRQAESLCERIEAAHTLDSYSPTCAGVSGGY